MKPAKIFLCTILLLFNSLSINANDGPFNVVQFDNRAGLSNSATNSLFIDRDKFLWIGTWDGLNYYDGYSFRHINYAKPEQKNGISNNVIQHIAEDDRDNIWITTIGGISRYEKKSGLIYNYFYSALPESISEHEYGVAVDSSGKKIYAYAPKHGLMLYNDAQHVFSPVQLPVNCGNIVKIAVHDEHLYLLNTEGKFYDFIISNNRLSVTFTTTDAANFFIVNRQLFIAQPGDFLQVYRNNMLIKKINTADNITAISFYHNHYLLALREKGFVTYDSSLSPSSYMNDVSKAYKEIRVTSFSNKPNGDLWIGTDGNGILKVTPRSQTFGAVGFSNLNIPYNIPVRAFCKTNNDLWIGTKGKGIIVLKNFDPLSASIHADNYALFSYPGQLDNNAVYAIKPSMYGNLVYIGTDASGLGVFNKSNNRFYKWENIIGSENAGSFGSVYCIYEDADSSLWLGTSGYGLVHLKFNIAHTAISISLFEKYTATGNDKGPINNIIYSIEPGSDGNFLWIGCRYGGLNIFNKQKKSFSEFNRWADDKGLSNNDVLYVYSDSKNNVWVGTSYGLNLLQNAQTLKEKSTVVQFTTENGLPNNTIHGIVEDANDNIWVSTNKGIAKISAQGEKIINYQETDGLQSSEFSDGSVWKGFNDRLFFGGIAGFNNFDPATIQQDKQLPNILISNTNIGGRIDNENKLLVVKPADKDTGIIAQTLERKSNYFECNIRTINYNNAAKCEISYYLEGYDKAWHTDKGISKIVYSNLPVGNYKLNIKWSNGNAVWSPEKTILTVAVKQYWWLTPLALIFYAIATAVIVYIIYKYRKEGIEEKHKLEKEKILRVKEEEIHQNRISFFTNIAHELQTPLTLVMGSFERILDKGAEPDTSGLDKTLFYKNIIQQQTAKLTYLLQQLFEFRKIETPYYQPNFNYVDISVLLKNLAEPFASISDSKKLNYDYCIEENLSGGIDKDKVEKIVFNLLSNAFKYTPEQENILFEARNINDALCITVYNSGIKLTDEEVAKLFDLFYTSDNKKNTTDKFGTGIGLAFTKQLTGLMNGKISVCNKEDGVCFEVSIPIQKHIRQTANEDHNKPSYLYKILTNPDTRLNYNSTSSINKGTILNTLIETNKDVIVIVEDDAEIRYLLRDILKNTYHVYEAENGTEGLNLVHQHNPALVISDVIMANMDGLELCRTIKNTNAICHIPVILLSARSTDEQQLEGYDAGADAYIGKPLSANHLLVRVKKLIEYRKKVNTVIKENTPTSNIKTLGLENEDEVFLSKVYDIIQVNISDPELNAQALETALCVSRMQLYRKLKSLSGMTPGEFIKNARLTTAAKLLQTTKLTVADIFYQTGFNNQSYFFREFKKKYNVSPNDYRSQNLKSSL
ncbi:MAG: response regulator [Chitinophagaceae bacterium]|nr:response regulator [Chitinophagaceae bacterium]